MTYKAVTIHLGMHKTGSSSIQSFLRANAERLAKASIQYPEYMGKKLADKMDGNHSLAMVQYPGKGNLKAFLDSRLTIETDQESLLLSAEYLSRPVAIRTILQGLVRLFSTSELRFVVYIRRYDHQVEASYAEGVKRKLSGDLDPMDRSHDLTSVLSPLFDLIGRENVTVRPFNPAHWAEGNLLADFLEAARIPPTALSTKEIHADITKNTRRPRLYTYVLSRLTKVVDKIAMAAFMDEHPELLPNDPVKYFLSPEDRIALNERQRTVDQPFFDAHGLGDIQELLGFGPTEKEPEWQPFDPSRQPIDRILFEFLNLRGA